MLVLAGGVVVVVVVVGGVGGSRGWPAVLTGTLLCQ